MQYQQREIMSKLFMSSITIVGITIFSLSLFNLSTMPNSLLILILFVVLLGVTEYYPFPAWKGYTTINFPLIYVMLLIYGLNLTIVVYSSVVLAVNLLHERPLRSILFNPAQLAISLYVTHSIVINSFAMHELTFSTSILNGILTYLSFLILFYIINNLLVDIVLWLRPQPYSFVNWKQKMLSESASALFATIYGVLFYILGNQNRGEVDVFSYFFFFSPLLALALIGSSFVRLNTEKNRLKRMFRLTRNLNTFMLKDDGYQQSMLELKDFMNCDEISFLVKEREWSVAFPSTMEPALPKDTQLKLDQINRMSEDLGPLNELFSEDMKAFIYAPLIVDNETLGMVIIAKSRSNSFTEAEKNVFATLANQLAAMLKAQNLVKEQQERHILEERNRIARNIHDGVAQNLAAAVLQLESSKRTLKNEPETSEQYIDRCMNHLRTSLWEVRNSIYTLRPPQNNQTGLIPAIHKKLNTFERQTDATIDFQIKGKPYAVSTMVEQVLFDIFQEAVNNSIKHSEADTIRIQLNYLSDEVQLDITDDGKGFSLFHEMIKAENEPHFGILQMNELAEKISASLDIQSKPDEGTIIRLIIPQLESEG